MMTRKEKRLITRRIPKELTRKVKKVNDRLDLNECRGILLVSYDQEPSNSTNLDENNILTHDINESDFDDINIVEWVPDL